MLTRYYLLNRRHKDYYNCLKQLYQLHKKSLPKNKFSVRYHIKGITAVVKLVSNEMPSIGKECIRMYAQVEHPDIKKITCTPEWDHTDTTWATEDQAILNETI